MITSNGVPPQLDASRHAAQASLDAFVARSGSDYTSLRNTDFGPGRHNHVSQLSAWLRHRCLLEDDVLCAVLASHSQQTASAFIQEVLWRGYFRGHLEHRPEIWSRFCEARHAARESADENTALASNLKTATSGTTGIECFDTWVHELISTGYLHNHARMWFASIWIFTLKLPWPLGADFFLEHLIDGDPASNTCSWRWVAGLHTQGKTYLARPDNIAQFTHGRFPHTAGLATEAHPLSEDPLPPAEPPRFEAPAALSSDCRTGLLTVESDCQPESLPLPAHPCSLLTLTDPCDRSIAPLASAARTFTTAALRDAHQRAAAAFDCHAITDNASDWQHAIQHWVTEQRLDVIAVARAPTGWVSDRLEPALQALEARGTCVNRITRPHDQAVWPHSSKGFFRVKKAIPDIMHQLGIATD